MSYINVSGLTKRFTGKPPTVAVDDLSIDIERGEFLVLLGPSGCGKTTTLRCLAGLETPDEGAISFADRTVFDSARRINLPPNKRSIGMVFQSFALWPHMTVRKNLAYPLRARRVRVPGSRAWVDETASLVDCAHLLDRYPGQLSGGQQQRVALARGLVARPDLVLFDEPLSNLDARLRNVVRAELHELHGRLGFTAVFVTHDQSEALGLGDRLAVMRDGRIEQLDTPETLFESPRTDYVAAFIGMSNRLDLQREGEIWTIDGSELTGFIDVARVEKLAVRLRPEDVLVAPSSAPLPDGCASVPATVVDREFGGRHMDVTLAIGTVRVQARVPIGQHGSWVRALERDQAVTAGFDTSAAVYFGDDGVRLAGKANGPSRDELSEIAVGA